MKDEFYGVIKEIGQGVHGVMYELPICSDSPIKVRVFDVDDRIKFYKNFFMTLELQDGEKVRVYSSDNRKRLIEC